MEQIFSYRNTADVQIWPAHLFLFQFEEVSPSLAFAQLLHGVSMPFE